MELTFSKKQIGPLIQKYGIAEGDEKFNTIIQLFNGQTNYQIWAIKMFYEGRVNLISLETIKEFINNHQTQIQNLEKGNIVSYKTKADISYLLKEMKGVEVSTFIKTWVNMFNTAQRALFREIIPLDATPIEVYRSSTFRHWNEIFSKVAKIPLYKREKMISLASAITDAYALAEHVENATTASYEWNREDLLSYIDNNTRSVQVVFDGDNVVVIKVGEFEDSKKLCGKGRTAWCLTRDDRYFRQYVKEPENATQYMLFNFNLPEFHDLAHIGFTVREGEGITNAHSTSNRSMLSKIDVDGEGIDIYTALKMAQVPQRVFIHLRELLCYEWGADSIVTKIKSFGRSFTLKGVNNGVVLAEINDNRHFMEMLGHTFISNSSIPFDSAFKNFVVFNTSVPYDDEESLGLITFSRDKYGILSYHHAVNAYRRNIDLKWFEKLGLKEETFVSVKDVDPSILIHKYIDENREDEAIALIEKNQDRIVLNKEIDAVLPIYSAVDHRMPRLFKAIINHPSFDINEQNAVGCTILDHLMYTYKIDGLTTAEDDTAVAEMIEAVLECGKYNTNAVNGNLDNAVNVACERPELISFAKRLIENPNNNINVVNDFGCTAIGNAIRKKNLNAIRALAKRPDLVLRTEDKEMAMYSGVDLSKYFSAEFLAQIPEPADTRDTSDLYAELFARAFARTVKTSIA